MSRVICPGFGYFILILKSLDVFRLFASILYHSNILFLDARGACDSFKKLY